MDCIHFEETQMAQKWTGLLALVLVATLAQAQECPESSLIDRVTTCAKANVAFLQCVSAESTPSIQCKCIRESPEMRACVGECYAAAELALCGSSSPDGSSSSYKPASSSFVQYKGTTQPLTGIDGIYVINLKRREDRLKRFFTNTTFKETDVHVQDAFDGQQLEWSDGLRALFGANTFGSRRTLVAHALSHFIIWRHIATTTGQYHLILEDDQTLPQGFVELWNSRLSWALPLDADIVYLGGALPSNASALAAVTQPFTRTFATIKPNTLFPEHFEDGIDFGNAADPSPVFPFASHAYILSSSAAAALQSLVATQGFRRPTAQMLLKLQRTHRVYLATPLPAHTAPVRGVDSDVQYDFTRLPEPGQPAELSLAYPAVESDLKPLPAINTLPSGYLLPTFAVSLPNSTDRMDHFKAVAAQASLKFHPFAAVDGTTLDMAALREKGVLSAEFPLHLRGTAGQALSHLILFESMIDGSFDAALVLEDDAGVDIAILAAINTTLPNLPQGWHVLGLDCPADCAGSGPSADYFIANEGCAPSLHAYLVSKSGAAILYSAAVPLRASLASQLAHHVGKDILLACATPHLAAHTTLRDERLTRNAQHQTREEL